MASGNISGNVTLNGINDAELIKILEVKEKNPQVTFNPQTMQAIQQPGNPPRQAYNNVQLGFGPGGLSAVRDLLSTLIGQ